MTRPTFVACATALALSGSAAPAAAHSDAVATWNANAGKAAVAACISPVGPSPAEARLYAMTQIAVHDALNAIRRRRADRRDAGGDRRLARGLVPGGDRI